MTKKLFLTPIVLIVACLCAGTYGAIHNQISYTISSEFFTKNQFLQFNIPSQIQNRLGAALVGWYASWWMGIVIGGFIIPMGLMIKDAKRFVVVTLKSFLIVTLTTALIGMCALIISYFTISKTTLPPFWYPSELVDKVDYARAGTMHNFSYFGGVFGIITGVFFIIWERKKTSDIVIAQNPARVDKKRSIGVTIFAWTEIFIPILYILYSLIEFWLYSDWNAHDVYSTESERIMQAALFNTPFILLSLLCATAGILSLKLKPLGRILNMFLFPAVYVGTRCFCACFGILIFSFYTVPVDVLIFLVCLLPAYFFNQPKVKEQFQ